MVTLSNGGPVESVSKLQPKSIKTTENYHKIVDKKLIDNVQKLKNIFGDQRNFKEDTFLSASL